MTALDTLTDLLHPIADLEFYPGNARIHDNAALRESLETNGQYRPVVACVRTNQVLAGNGTLAAARDLGWSHIAVTWVDVDEDAARRIVLVDNRANDLAGYDEARLLDLLREVPDLTGTGYDAAYLDGLLAVEAASSGAEDPAGLDDIPDVPSEPITKPGDVWLLGPHRLICGDCRDPGVVEAVLAGTRIGVAFTSPPYASQRSYDPSSGFTPIPPDGYSQWFAAVAGNVAAHLAPDGSWFVNIKEHREDGQRHLYVKDLVLTHVRQWSWRLVDEFCWYDTHNGFPGGSFTRSFKNAWEPVFHFTLGEDIKFNPLANGTPSDNVIRYDLSTNFWMNGDGAQTRAEPTKEPGLARPSNVLKIPAGGGVGGHSAAFPVALPRFFIKAFSDEGDAVFDPFMGSGSTLIAAADTGRIGYGVEISPGYCDVIARRWQGHSGVVPVLESTGEAVDFAPDARSDSGDTHGHLRAAL